MAEGPELIELAVERTRDTLPEYNYHGDVLNRYWGRLTEERADFQLAPAPIGAERVDEAHALSGPGR